MTAVNVVYREGYIGEVTVKGHSGYAKHGRDIVCAAVSAVVQTALMGVMKYSSKEVDVVVNEESGYLHFAVPELSEEERKKVEVILDTMLLGLRDIESGYGSYVKVEVK